MAKRQHAVLWRDGSIEILGAVPDGALLLASGRTDGLVKILNATTGVTGSDSDWMSTAVATATHGQAAYNAYAELLTQLRQQIVPGVAVSFINPRSTAAKRTAAKHVMGKLH